MSQQSEEAVIHEVVLTEEQEPPSESDSNTENLDSYRSTSSPLRSKLHVTMTKISSRGNVSEALENEEGAATESDSNVSDYPESNTPLLRLASQDLAFFKGDRKMLKNDLLLAARLSENRHKDALHERAKKLKHHYREMEACNKIMAYGFIAIIFLLTGFYWFIMIFNQEIKETFHSRTIIAPAFVYGSLILGAINLFL